MKRPALTPYARHGLGLFGDTCGAVHALAARMAERLKTMKTLYVDTNHTALDDANYCNRSSSWFDAELTNEINQFTFSIGQPNLRFTPTDERPNRFDLADFSSDFDLALINANHYTPDATALLWNADRFEKIRKRAHQLAACRFVYGASPGDLPDDLRERLGSATYFHATDAGFEAFCAAVSFFAPPPVVKGLVLAGGRSTRMGKNKALIEYHGRPQYAHALALLESCTEEAHLSVAQPSDYDGVERRIVDRFTNMGPFGAILSAFMHDPDAAWLVLASDLPLVDVDLLSEIIERRNRQKLATAFLNPATGFPDPLCTLWEPRAYRRMLTFMSVGYSCPRKVLINSEIELLEPKHPDKLSNINTPEDLQQFRGA